MVTNKIILHFGFFSPNVKNASFLLLPAWADLFPQEKKPGLPLPGAWPPSPLAACAIAVLGGMIFFVLSRKGASGTPPWKPCPWGAGRLGSEPHLRVVALTQRRSGLPQDSRPSPVTPHPSPSPGGTGRAPGRCGVRRPTPRRCLAAPSPTLPLFASPDTELESAGKK